MTCPHCQQPLPEPAGSFCPHCGGALEPLEPLAALLPTPGPPPSGGDGGTPWDRHDQLGFGAALVETTRQIFTAPAAFFKTVQPSRGLGGPLLYALILGYVGVVASALYETVLFSILGPNWTGVGRGTPFGSYLGYAQGFGSLLFTLILGPVMVAVRLFLRKRRVSGTDNG